jgi:hypothetical protein
MSTWVNQSKSQNEVTWENTLLDWTSILTWVELFFFNNQVKH